MPRHRTTETKSTPKIMMEVTERQFDTLKRHLPYGFQKQVFKAIIEDMVQMWEEFGDDFTRALIAKNLTYKQFMEDYTERQHVHIKGFEEDKLPSNELGGAIRMYQSDQIAEKREERTKEIC